MSAQIPLDLPHRASMAREDYLVGAANREAYAAMSAWPDWPAHTILLAGPAGCGKTHLAEIWREAASGESVAARDLTEESIDTLAARPALVVEDLQDGPLPETPLFHLLNRMREHGGFVVLTTRVWPSALGISLPDLASRLGAAQPVEIGEPDDELLRAVLAKLFADRQLEVSAAVIEFIVRRMERSLGSARDIVARLDRRALAESRSVTRPLATLVLDEVTASEALA